jgi:hypothetical protein
MLPEMWMKLILKNEEFSFTEYNIINGLFVADDLGKRAQSNHAFRGYLLQGFTNSSCYPKDTNTSLRPINGWEYL